MKTWQNHDEAVVVKKIIDQNFNDIQAFFGNAILSMGTDKRLNLPLQYLVNGLVVYDSDLGQWFKYTNGAWETYEFPGGGGGSVTPFVKNFTEMEWENGEITIPATEHNTSVSSINVFMIDYYTQQAKQVFVDVEITPKGDITLKTDYTFDGKVMIL